MHAGAIAGGLLLLEEMRVEQPKTSGFGSTKGGGSSKAPGAAPGHILALLPCPSCCQSQFSSAQLPVKTFKIDVD